MQKIQQDMMQFLINHQSIRLLLIILINNQWSLHLVYQWYSEQNENDYEKKQLFDGVRKKEINWSIENEIFLALNLTGGDFNSQFGLQSWSYEVPTEKRTTVPPTYTFLPPPPPNGLSAFTARKRKYIRRKSMKWNKISFRSLSKTSCSRSPRSRFVLYWHLHWTVDFI